MKLGVLKSLGHNISDSLASGAGLMIGYYLMDIFAEATGEPDGYVIVNFLTGRTSSSIVSQDLAQAVGFYRDALPELCAKHAIEVSQLKRLETRYGTDPVYGRHFLVTVECSEGKHSTDRYVGNPGKRFRQRR
jgi:hypothetical protein